MTIRRFISCICITAMLISPLNVLKTHAVEQWSVDWWNEKPSTTDNPVNNEQKSSPGGLWSEELWQNTPIGQPDTSNTEQPIEKPSPIKDIDLNAHQLIMQVENNKAMVNGAEKEIQVPPTIINGRMMVPLKFTVEALGGTYSFVESERKSTVMLNGKKMELWGGKTIASVNSNTVQLDTPPVVLEGATLVPIRFISENFGYPVFLEGESNTIMVRKNGESKQEPKPVEVPKPEEKPGPVVVPKPEEKEDHKPTITSSFNYFGTWNLQMDGMSGGLPMGTLIVLEDGTYGMRHGISGTAIGKWRQGATDEVIGYKDMLILENGPGGMDWVMIPKSDGMVSVRYHYGYDITNKIWFVDSLGIQNKY